MWLAGSCGDTHTVREDSINVINSELFGPIELFDEFIIKDERLPTVPVDDLALFASEIVDEVHHPSNGVVVSLVEEILEFALDR